MGAGNLNREATKGSIEHGNVNSKGHADDQAQQAKRRKKHVVYVEEDEPEKFQSVLLGLAPEATKGRTLWRTTEGKLKEMDGAAWVEKLNDEAKKFRCYDEVRRSKRKAGFKTTYHNKPLPESDCRRKTIELRPDHSRALEYLAAKEQKSSVAELLGAIRAETVRLFEEIYGRRVVAVGEHCDSGHYHNDVWHVGTKETEVEVEVWGKKKTKTVMLRDETTWMREYGVGPGASRWDRHQRVLDKLGRDKSVLGIVPKLVEAAAEAAKKQNGEEARDLRFMRVLDAFVERALKELDPVVLARANREYADFVEEGYRTGTLGAKKVEKRKAKVEKLEAEVGRLQGIVALFAEFVKALVRVPAMKKILGLPAIAPLFQRALAACGLTLAKTKAKQPEMAQPEIAQPEMEGPDLGAMKKRLKEQMKKKEEEVEMRLRRKRREEPDLPSL